MTTDELYHFGVKGMKWGVRKKRYETSDTRKRYDSTKAAYKSAKKDYNKAFDKAYNYSQTHPVGQFVSKKAIAESDRRWNDAINKADAANKARAEYKKAKKDRKNKIKDTTKAINKQSSVAEKMIFNDATRKKAAKYMVDNNMSMSEATKKANKEAIRNTAVIIGAIGAASVASSMVGRTPSYSVLDTTGRVLKNVY